MSEYPDYIPSEFIPRHELRFKADGSYKILMLSDFHGGTGFSPELTRAIALMVSDTSPDLVLIGGDMSGCGCELGSLEELKSYLSQVTAPMENAHIPWAHVFGNHDNNKGFSNAAQEPVYEGFEYCVSKAGRENIHGTANYVLPILSSDGKRIAYNIFALDTHDNHKLFFEDYGIPADTKIILPKQFTQGSGHDSVHFDQIQWYYDTSVSLERLQGGKIPAIMYMHMPIPEYCLVQQNSTECNMTGEAREKICCNELNPGLFSACLQRGDVRGIFCGHEHLNNFSGEYCGVTLAYDAGLCFDVWIHDDMRGGRIIELNENEPDKVSTRFVRLIDIEGWEG